MIRLLCHGRVAGGPDRDLWWYTDGQQVFGCVDQLLAEGTGAPPEPEAPAPAVEPEPPEPEAPAPAVEPEPPAPEAPAPRKSLRRIAEERAAQREHDDQEARRCERIRMREYLDSQRPRSYVVHFWGAAWRVTP